MNLCLATIGPRGISPEFRGLMDEFLKRAGRFGPVEHRRFGSEAAFLAAFSGKAGRTQPVLVLADSRGSQLSSEELAALVGKHRDGGTQELVLGIGPADGWTAEALGVAAQKVAFGRITLPHELATVVAAEQIYRALAILAGHPYHKGHRGE
jgi:23S rRNA (pseudouridine1915-N3)-methyltransferase